MNDNTTIDVVSELNPAYLKTGSMSDYYGVYKVCQLDAEGRVKRTIAVFSDKYDSGAARTQAYRLAALSRGE